MCSSRSRSALINHSSIHESVEREEILANTEGTFSAAHGRDPLLDAIVVSRWRKDLLDRVDIPSSTRMATFHVPASHTHQHTIFVQQGCAAAEKEAQKQCYENTQHISDWKSGARSENDTMKYLPIAKTYVFVINASQAAPGSAVRAEHRFFVDLE